MLAEPESWAAKMRAARDHREFVGPADEYDVNAAMQFNLLTHLGLREFHTLLDIGCGSLRGGRLFIVYLLPAHYFGIEPERWLVESGISTELGQDVIELKSPSFSHKSDFECSVFNREFDYILAQCVFVIAPEWQIRQCVSEAAKCMKPTSLFAATYMQGDENYTGSEWLYPATTTYTCARMADIACAAGLSCVPIECAHPRGARWIVLCKPEDEKRILALADTASALGVRKRLSELEPRLAEAEQRLSQLTTHPSVKIGVGLRRFLRRVVRLR